MIAKHILNDYVIYSLHEDPRIQPILIPAARPHTLYVINMNLLAETNEMQSLYSQ